MYSFYGKPYELKLLTKLSPTKQLNIDGKYSRNDTAFSHYGRRRLG